MYMNKNKAPFISIVEDLRIFYFLVQFFLTLNLLFCGNFAAKRAHIVASSNESQITQTRYRYEIIRLYEQGKSTLHFYR